MSLELPRCALCRVQIQPGQDVSFRIDGRVDHAACPKLICPTCSNPIEAGQPIRRDGEQLLHGNCWIRQFRRNANHKSSRDRASTLPTTAPVLPDRPLAVMAPPVEKSAGPLHGIRILVVDDNDDNRYLLEESLRFMGAEVHAAASAEAALLVLKGADIIITDFALSDHDGAWLLEQVRSLSARPIPVILVSGFTETQRPAIAEAQFAWKMLKPVEPADLGKVVLGVLARR